MAFHYPTSTVTLQNRDIVYTVRESSRARSPNLRVAPGEGLVMTVPRSWPWHRAETFLRRHQDWVLRWSAQLERRWHHLPLRWPYGASVLYQGRACVVQMVSGRAGAVEVSCDGGLIVSTRAPGIEGARRALRAWLTEHTTRHVGSRVECFSALMSLRPGRIYVRPLRRAWGRCWQSGSLSFNSMLSMAPPEALDYVVVHELAHLRVPNHARSFWDLVGAYQPDYAARRAWLRAYGPLLIV